MLLSAGKKNRREKTGVGLGVVVLTVLQKRGFISVVGMALCMLASSVVQSEDAPETDLTVRELISERCLDCHQGEAAEASVDLAAVLDSMKHQTDDHTLPHDLQEIWLRVEKVVTQGRMPPLEEDSLSVDELDQFKDWFHGRLVLRDGLPHIGTTPLRRLTHEEFIASLEDLLEIEMRSEYNHLKSVHVEKGFVDRVLPVEVPGKSGFVNDAESLASQPIPLLAYIKCIDFALSKMSGNPASIEMLTGTTVLPEKLSEEQVRKIAQPFLRRALRGNATNSHLENVVRVFTKAQETKAAMVAFKSMLRTILLLPEFHYRLESGKKQKTPYRISDHEFATRLSYFLTGSTPDGELLDAASSGTLREAEVLDSQIQRLMSSPRRLSLSESFAAQWIGFDALIDSSATDAQGVSTTVRAQYDELLYFFDELFKSDLSLLDVIDSDWMYISNYTINSYGKDQFAKPPEINSQHANVLQRRSLMGNARRGIEQIYDPPVVRGVQSERFGGVITSAGVMSLTSAPQRTSPVRRGVWILDRLLGQPLEAPANVPPIEKAMQSLPADKPGKLEIIRAHTAMPSCIVCHKDIDPIGFGLENFDSLGRWRTNYPDKSPVSSDGTLPSGKSFSSPKELKQLLLTDYRDLIVRNFIRRMMAYALGRSLRPHDRITEDSIYQHVVKQDYRSNSVIRAIIDSPQFNCRQDEGS
ncbi:DUF1588 domain-containing protein [bacterium]|nr:DUF1588 domain-containing protein [bacterium]